MSGEWKSIMMLLSRDQWRQSIVVWPAFFDKNYTLKTSPYDPQDYQKSCLHGSH